MKNPNSFEKQLEIFTKGTVDLISKTELLGKLKEQRPLKIKAGFDPSRPDLHIGHAVLFNKLRQFQDCGHEVIFVVGDWTACIGDPSGQNKSRPPLDIETARKNAETYMEQVTGTHPPRETNPGDHGLLRFFQKLDPKKTKKLCNSQWLNALDLRDFLIKVASKFTVARQLERQDFASRFKAGKPVGLHEFLYPLIQAYDSVHLKADVELGGSDQIFNLLLGRELQKEMGQKPQVVLTLPLLEGLDGVQKMSKSFDNFIGFKDSPKEIYGKSMKISDDLLSRWIQVFTEGTKNLKKAFEVGSLLPKKEKENLAHTLVLAFHGEAMAKKAREEFLRVFSKKGLPDHIPEKWVPASSGLLPEKLLTMTGLFESASAGRRAVLSGAVRKNGQKLEDPLQKMVLSPGGEFLLSFGRRNFIKVKVKAS